VVTMSPVARRRHRDVRRADVPAMVVVVCGDVEVASWPLAGWDRPDLSVVDELARWQLTARRLGCSIQLRGACVELLELLELVGLGDVVSAVPKSVGTTERIRNPPPPEAYGSR
jgi:ABC-type transporter Mla MlaB component